MSQQQKRVSSKNSNCTTPTKPLRPLSVNATISPVNSDQHQFESAAAFEKRERLMAVTIEEQVSKYNKYFSFLMSKIIL